MNNKLGLALRLAAQIVGLTAVAALVPAHDKSYFDAAVAIIGVAEAFFATPTITP